MKKLLTTILAGALALGIGGCSKEYQVEFDGYECKADSIDMEECGVWCTPPSEHITVLRGDAIDTVKYVNVESRKRNYVITATTPETRKDLLDHFEDRSTDKVLQKCQWLLKEKYNKEF